jgi:hypothetical protein
MKKSKKNYARTEKQKRKDKTVKIIGWYNAPKSFRKYYNKEFRNKCKQILYYNIINECDKPYPIPGKHTAQWDCW